MIRSPKTTAAAILAGTFTANEYLIQVINPSPEAFMAISERWLIAKQFPNRLLNISHSILFIAFLLDKPFV
jgi:hypothetical protein